MTSVGSKLDLALPAITLPQHAVFNSCHLTPFISPATACQLCPYTGPPSSPLHSPCLKPKETLSLLHASVHRAVPYSPASPSVYYPSRIHLPPHVMIHSSQGKDRLLIGGTQEHSNRGRAHGRTVMSGDLEESRQRKNKQRLWEQKQDTSQA